MATAKEIFYKIKHFDEKRKERNSQRFRDNLSYEMKQTLKITQRLKNRGFSPERIKEEVEKSREMPQPE